MAKRRAAFVNGRRASIWFMSDDCLCVRGQQPRDEALVPVAHFADESEMARHYSRLSMMPFVTKAAIDELREIAAGVRR